MTRLLAAALLTALVVAHIRRAQAQARREAIRRAEIAAALEAFGRSADLLLGVRRG